MNKVILMGRLTKDPDVRNTGDDSSKAVAKYTLAVDRKFKRDGEDNADFINCTGCRVCGEIFVKGNQACCYWKNPDWKLYQ